MSVFRVVSLLPIAFALTACSPSVEGQKTIASNSIARTLAEADRSSTVRELQKAVATQDLLTASAGERARDWELRRPSRGLFGLGQSLGNAAGAQVARRQQNRLANLRDYYAVKLQVARHTTAWSKMTGTEQEYVERHAPDFMKWLDKDRVVEMATQIRKRNERRGR